MSAELFLAAIGGRASRKSSSGWVSAECPLARWKHASGKDAHPSFAVHWDKDAYKCFACGGGPLAMLLRELHENDPAMDLARATALVMDRTSPPIEVVDFEPSRPDSVWEVSDVCWSPAWKSSGARAYLESRGVGRNTCEALGIGWDPLRNAVVFPYWNWSGALVGARGRRIPPHDGIRYHYYEGSGRNSDAWYGEWLVDGNRPVVFVESVFDAAAVHPHWSNVMAPLLASLSDRKVARVAHLREVHVMFDNDDAGRAGAEYLSRRLPGKAGEIDCSPWNDPGAMDSSELLSRLRAVLSGPFKVASFQP